MTLEILLFILLSLFGVLLSALCAGLETGVYTINRVRLAVRAGTNHRRASRLKFELDHPERLLITLLVLNNLANYLGSLGIAGVLDDGMPHAPPVLLGGAVAVLQLVWRKVLWLSPKASMLPVHN